MLLTAVFQGQEQSFTWNLEHLSSCQIDSVSTHLNEEEAGCRGRVMVDVHGDQYTGNYDEHHQEDAEDQTNVQRVWTWHPVHSTVCRHHWKTTQQMAC